MKKYPAVLFLLLYSVLLFSQTPMTVSLDHNPDLRGRKTKMTKNSMQADTVSLPFFDDFSYYWRTSQPDQKLWTDNYVYINNSFPIEPPSNGVATFDALDADGNVYKNASSTFPADTLTSCPIDLGESELKNVYLSFFYQPQGYGDSPEEGDSLTVQFKLPGNDKWRTVWNIPGTALCPFKQALIRVEDEYMYKGFQFRFVNYVSLEQNPFNPGRRDGNADHWHIDYVRLDKNRSETDTAAYDVAMIAPMKSLIKGYQSIPWDQWKYAYTTKLEPRAEITYRNNNNDDSRVDRHFAITDLYYNNTENIYSGSENIEAGEIINYKQDIFSQFETISADSALFEIRGYLTTTDPDDRKANDTVRYYQFFKDYFARDDGCPESGYGFNGYNAQGCAIACRYETFKPENLKAIMIYFNSTVNNVTALYRFRVAVWRDNNGRPGELAYISSAEYSPKTTGKFTKYNLDEEVYVTQYQPYWIGWVQVTSGFLNVGFDRNYNDRGNLWYNTGRWQEDRHNGTLMIRPVMGKREIISSSELSETDSDMLLYPNPASQQVRIEFKTFNYSDYYIEIYDVAGRLHYQASYTADYIDVSRFEQGLYLIRLINNKSGNAHVKKLIINR